MQGAVSVVLPGLRRHEDEKGNILSFYLKIADKKLHDCC